MAPTVRRESFIQRDREQLAIGRQRDALRGLVAHRSGCQLGQVAGLTGSGDSKPEQAKVRSKPTRSPCTGRSPGADRSPRSGRSTGRGTPSRTCPSSTAPAPSARGRHRGVRSGRPSRRVVPDRPSGCAPRHCPGKANQEGALSSLERFGDLRPRPKERLGRTRTGRSARAGEHRPDRAGTTKEPHVERDKHPRLQGRRSVPGRVRPQGDRSGRARDAGPHVHARGVRRRRSRSPVPASPARCT